MMRTSFAKDYTIPVKNAVGRTDTLYYTTTEPVAPDVRKTIEADAKRLNKERPWWCENIFFFKHRKQPKHLTGDTKLFLNLGDEILDDEDDEAMRELEFDDDQFMGYYEARFILFPLANWSKRLGVSWIVQMAGEEVARVVNGLIETEWILESNATAEQIQQDDERARLIHAKYAKRQA